MNLLSVFQFDELSAHIEKINVLRKNIDFQLSSRGNSFNFDLPEKYYNEIKNKLLGPYYSNISQQTLYTSVKICGNDSINIIVDSSSDKLRSFDYDGFNANPLNLNDDVFYQSSRDESKGTITVLDEDDWSWLFAGCDDLSSASIKIPIYISGMNNMFKDCKNLEQINFYFYRICYTRSLNDSTLMYDYFLKNIPKDIFKGCSKLKNINIYELYGNLKPFLNLREILPDNNICELKYYNGIPNISHFVDLIQTEKNF